MHRLLIIILSLSILSSATRGSDYYYKLDSLEKILALTEDLRRAEVLYELAYHTAPWDQELSMTFIKEQEELIDGMDDPVLLGNLHQNYGDYYYYTDNYIESVDHFNKALQFFEQVDEYEKLATIYFKLVVTFFNARQFDKATGFFPALYELGEKIESKELWSVGLFGMGYFYTNVLQDFDKSKEVHKQALDLALESNLKSKITGGIMNAYGYAYVRAGQYDSALALYRKAQNVFDTTNPDDRLMMVQNLYEMGNIFTRTLELDSALWYLERSQAMAEEMTAIYPLSYIHAFLGSVYAKMNDYSSAIAHYKEAARNAELTDSLGVGFLKEEFRFVPVHSWDLYTIYMTPYMLDVTCNVILNNSYRSLAGLYEEIGGYEKALAFLEKKQEATNELRKIEEAKALLGIQLTYESEKKDRQILLLSQQNELNEFKVRQSQYFLYGLIGLIIIIGALAYLFIRQNKLKNEQRNTVLEQKLLRSQMNPHFIFNALSNISNLIDKNDNETASTYLSKFASLVRHILESTRSDFIELDKEISNLENYLSLQKLRFEEKFEYRIDVDKAIDTGEVSIPSMLIQPFVENAIEHGIKPKETKGHIAIRLLRENGTLNCVIDDDGIGRKKSMELRSKSHRSLATSITQERLEALNRKLKKKVALEITDLESELGTPLGTRVNILLPTTL